MAVSAPCWGAASALWLSGAARCTADGFLLWQLFSAFTLWIHCVNLTFRWWREENCTYKWALNLLQTVCCGRCRTVLSPVDKTNLSSRSTFFLFCSFGPSLVAFIHSNVSPVVVLSLCHALLDWKRILSTTNGHRGIIVNTVAADRNGARLHTGMQTEVE